MSIFRKAKLAALVCVLPTVASAEDAIPSYASSCVSCHSADGNPLVAGVPILAGQRADYLETALKAYRGKRRIGGGADVMWNYAKDLSDSDIQRIAKWFSEN